MGVGPLGPSGAEWARVTAFLFVFLFLAAMAGGALNAVAGGGSFLALPALLYAGVPPVAANATSTLAMWPGSVSSAWAYRRDIGREARWLPALGGVSLVGGLLGARLLISTSDTSFMRLLPWLMLVAAVAVTFTFSGSATARVGLRPHTLWLGALAAQLAIATYGGYFGGGMGIVMLATLAMAGMTDIHEMNGVKSVLAAAINAVALATFVLHGAVAWRPGFVMVAGAIVGGYAGASLARRIDPRTVRALIVIVAWAMTGYFLTSQDAVSSRIPMTLSALHGIDDWIGARRADRTVGGCAGLRVQRRRSFTVTVLSTDA